VFANGRLAGQILEGSATPVEFRQCVQSLS
jgi:hypothetical protein